MAWDIVKKIQQMLAKAESTDSLAESETIMMKVDELLTKHGISLLQIGPMAQSNDPVDVSHDACGFWASDNWMRKLSAAAGEYYRVEVIWHRRGNHTGISVVGRESCRAAYIAMLPYLRLQVMRLARRGVSAGRYSTASRARTQIGLALAERLYALVYQRKRTPKTERQVAGENMLVPVDEIEIIMREHFADVKEIKVRSSVRISREAVIDAGTVSLADQVASGNLDRRVIERRPKI